MLTKLFEVRMVASSFSGLSRFFSTLLFVLPLFCSFCLSVALSEKYATSDPLIKAELNSRSITITILMAIPKVNG
ncbi:MAG: hypothetical protein L3J54_12005 [Draconibacterium sp.]|nr:hypothetical protein [Draconibacterium sp.]